MASSFICLVVIYMFICSQITLCKIAVSPETSTPADTGYKNDSTSLQVVDISPVTTAKVAIPVCPTTSVQLTNSSVFASKKIYSFPANLNCHLNVRVDEGLKTVITVEGLASDDTTILKHVYIDRTIAAEFSSSTSNCLKRLISLPVDRTIDYYKLELLDVEFVVFIQANVTLTFQAFYIAADVHIDHHCPTLTHANYNTTCDNSSCNPTAGEESESMQIYYDDVVTCTNKIVYVDWLYENETLTMCNVKCPLNCRCELGYRNYTETCEGLQKVRDIFLAFPSFITNFDLSFMNLSSLASNSFDMFKGHKGLKKIDLNHNQISDLNPALFTGLDDLTDLYIADNLLETIKSGVFHDLKALMLLDLAQNNIHSLENGAFTALPSLFSLDLTSNNLSRLEAPIFDSITSVKLLKLGDNAIESTDLFVFRHTKSILLLDLAGNRLERIEPGTFHGLEELLFLFLADNDLTAIECGTFNGLTRMISLTLSNNNLTDIYQNSFKGLSGLSFLRLDENLLRKLDSTAFVELKSLQSLDLRMNRLDRVNIDTFDGITNETKILVDNHSVCCFVKEANCIATYPKQVFLTCGQLLPYNVLRVVLSILGSLALIGNAMVLYWRCRIRRRDNKVQFLLIVNLSASDLLMGIYMMILVSGDAHFGERFPLEADTWRRSQTCKLAGFLAVLSSEASAFFVTLISIDRLLGVKYPFSSHRLGNKSARLAITGVWFLAILLSVVLTLLTRIDPDMYALSEVCIGLPMARRWVNNQYNITVDLENGKENVEVFETVRTEPGMYLSIAVFLGLNLLCFLAIAYCYIVIFITAQKTSRRASRRREKEEEIRMAAKMSVIVVTDFLCWMPIIIIGILVQSGAVEISPVVYAWIVTFVLPINSSANPFLYTIATILSDRIGKRQKGSSLDSQCGKKFNGTHYYLTDTYEQVLNGNTGCDSLSQEGNV